MFEFSNFGVWISDFRFRSMDVGFQFFAFGPNIFCIDILGSRRLMLDTVPELCF